MNELVSKIALLRPRLRDINMSKHKTHISTKRELLELTLEKKKLLPTNHGAHGLNPHKATSRSKYY
jgi:hypothetical protein